MLARIVAGVTVAVCLAGCCCTLSSYARYREIAHYSPPAARDWHLWGTALVGPYLFCAVGALVGRRFRGVTLTALAVALFLGALSAWDRCTPVIEQQMDPDEDAGLRLYYAAIVQYFASIPMFIAGVVAATVGYLTPPTSPLPPTTERDGNGDRGGTQFIPGA